MGSDDARKRSDDESSDGKQKPQGSERKAKKRTRGEPAAEARRSGDSEPDEAPDSEQAPKGAKGVAALLVSTKEFRRQDQLSRLDWMAGTCVNLRRGETESGKADVLVVGLDRDNAEARLSDLQEYRDTGGQAMLFLLARDATASQLHWAAELTPHCLNADLAPADLASCVDHLAVLWQARVQESKDKQESVRRVVIRVGEGMETDSIPVKMGDAVRNFLSLLSHRKNEQLPKHEEVAVGKGSVRAGECRRRLGKAVGRELVTLLVDDGGRGGSYRLRQPAEVAELCRRFPAKHVWTELQVRQPSRF